MIPPNFLSTFSKTENVLILKAKKKNDKGSRLIAAENQPRRAGLLDISLYVIIQSVLDDFLDRFARNRKLSRSIYTKWLIYKEMATKIIADQDFLEFIIKALVDHPDDVKVERKVDEMGVLLSLKLNPEDMGQIIGRAGSTARAIRSLVRIVGLKNHARVNLKIEEPEGGRAPRRAVSGEEAPTASAPIKTGLEDLNL